MRPATENLVRKQIMLSNKNIKKLKSISKERGVSMAEVVRLAVEDYNTSKEEIGDQELMLLVSERLRQAIKEIERVSRKVRKTVAELESR